MVAAFRTLVLPDQRLVIGYSGGLDSTVLLHAAATYQASANFEIAAFHVNHGLSPSADQWQVACSTFSASLGVKFDVASINVDLNAGDGLELAARRARYRAFDHIDAHWIALAHHADDQAETLLHNLARGAGVLGLAGIPACRGRFLRPFLNLSRANLVTYAERENLNWIDDDSNLNIAHTRNYFRREVIPYIKKRFPDFSQKSALVGRRMAEAQDLLNELALIDAGETGLRLPFSAQCFDKLSAARSANLLRALLVANQIQPPPEVRLTEFIFQLKNADSDRHPEIRLNDLLLRRKRGWLELIQFPQSPTDK